MLFYVEGQTFEKTKTMKIEAKHILNRLIQEVKVIQAHGEALESYSDAELNFRKSSESWSILECLEHMNLYGDFYLPEIQSAVEASKHQPEKVFKSGILGNYFANSMLPKEKLNKMKTFKDKNPLHSELDRSVVQRFIQQQGALLDLLEQASRVSLNRTKTGISISRMIRLKLGDTFRFLINHEIRHIAQIKRLQEVLQQNRVEEVVD